MVLAEARFEYCSTIRLEANFLLFYTGLVQWFLFVRRMESFFFFYLLLEPFLPFTEFNMAQPYSSPAAVPPGLEYLSQVSMTFGNKTCCSIP